jgi:hypothetical protein
MLSRRFLVNGTLLFCNRNTNIRSSANMSDTDTWEGRLTSTTVVQSRRPRPRSPFAEAVRDAVSDSLSMLGDSQKAAVTRILKRDYQVDVEAPGTDLQRIFAALRGLFGIGAPLLIDPIMQKLSLNRAVGPRPQLRL